MEKVTIEHAQFMSGRVACAARLFVPPRGTGNGAGVVLGHGLGGTMDTGLFPVAQKLADAGFHALAFDYRFFGQSGGKTRQFVSVPMQMQDWCEAIEHLRGHAEVDAHRLGLWGISFSGGYVLQLQHQDDEIKAVIAQVPHIDAQLSAAVGNFYRDDKMNEALFKEVMGTSKARSLFGKPRMVQLIDEDKSRPAVLAAKEGRQYLEIVGPSWRNEINARSFITGRLDKNNAATLAHDMEKPILIQFGTEDEIVSNEAIRHFARRAGPIVQLSAYECGHFGLLVKPHFSVAMREAVDFFTQTLLT